MPRRITHDELPARPHTGAGRAKVFDFDFSALPGIAGQTARSKKTGKDEPVYIEYEPADMANLETGQVASQGTFASQVHGWVAEYNETLPDDAPKFRATMRNTPIMDGAVHVRGTVNENGEIVRSEDESETKLYTVAVGIVPLTERDLRNREARLSARGKAGDNSKPSKSKAKAEATS